LAGNSTSDNIGPLHLINVKRLAYVVRKGEGAGAVSRRAIKRAEEPAGTPPIEAVDYVGESDVRAAVTQSKKIYIGAKYDRGSLG